MKKNSKDINIFVTGSFDEPGGIENGYKVKVLTDALRHVGFHAFNWYILESEKKYKTINECMAHEIHNPNNIVVVILTKSYKSKADNVESRSGVKSEAEYISEAIKGDGFRRFFFVKPIKEIYDDIIPNLFNASICVDKMNFYDNELYDFVYNQQKPIPILLEAFTRKILGLPDYDPVEINPNHMVYEKKLARISNNNFVQKIKNSKKDLRFSHESTVYYAWLCAVRALPFLSEQRTAFSYWTEEKRQYYLYSVLNAIDVAYAILKLSNTRKEKQWYVTATHSAADARVAADAAYDYYKARRISVQSAGYASDAAVAVAYAAAYTSSSHRNAFEHARVYVDRAARSANLGVEFAGLSKTLQDIVISDISKINSNEFNALNNDTTLYGKIWDYFLSDLKTLKCEYWAKLYADLFSNRFIVDLAELERRLNAPDEIKMHGARAVAEYLIATRNHSHKNK